MNNLKDFKPIVIEAVSIAVAKMKVENRFGNCDFGNCTTSKIKGEFEIWFKVNPDAPSQNGICQTKISKTPPKFTGSFGEACKGQIGMCNAQHPDCCGNCWS